MKTTGIKSRFTTRHFITKANTSMDGTGQAVYLLTAQSHGIAEIQCNATGTSIATTLRIWLNNGGDQNDSMNNALALTIDIPASTKNQNDDHAPTYIYGGVRKIRMRDEDRLFATMVHATADPIMIASTFEASM